MLRYAHISLSDARIFPAFALIRSRWVLTGYVMTWEEKGVRVFGCHLRLPADIGAQRPGSLMTSLGLQRSEVILRVRQG